MTIIQKVIYKFTMSKRFRPVWNLIYRLICPLTRAGGIISQVPALYLWYAKHIKPDTFWEAPDADTDLLIEGAGASATHSLVAYVRKHNPELKISHTCEVPATVKYCLAKKIPVIVPVRNIMEYVDSLVTRFPQTSDRTARLCYTSFYEYIIKVRHRVVVADFHDIVENPAEVVRRCNEFYGTDFNVGDNQLPAIRVIQK
jgi:hypothetical protein